MNKSDGSDSISSGRIVVLIIVSSATVVGHWPRSQQEADIENMEGESDEQWWVEVEGSIALPELGAASLAKATPHTVEMSKRMC